MFVGLSGLFVAALLVFSQPSHLRSPVLRDLLDYNDALKLGSMFRYFLPIFSVYTITT